MGQFYLGFFAAVTIETKDVWLDLNGFSIQQKKDFYVTAPDDEGTLRNRFEVMGVCLTMLKMNMTDASEAY